MTTVAKLFGTIVGTSRATRVPYGNRGVIVTLAEA